jgi:hypothetical protein
MVFRRGGQGASSVEIKSAGEMVPDSYLNAASVGETQKAVKGADSNAHRGDSSEHHGDSSGKRRNSGHKSGRGFTIRDKEKGMQLQRREERREPKIGFLLCALRVSAVCWVVR